MQKSPGLSLTQAQIKNVGLTFNEEIVVNGFMEERHQSVTAHRLGISQPMVSMILKRAFRKIKKCV